jgi:hypothetical protein
MSADLAARWASTVVPSWLYRWLMPAAWIAASAVTLLTVDDVPCSEDPAICAPDVAYSLTLVPFLASLFLWWWQPRGAAVAGLAFLVVQLWYDDGAVMVEWALYATACAALLSWWAVSRRRQVALTAALPSKQVMVPPAKPLGLSGRLVVAVLLLVVGAAALGVMRWQDRQEQTHVRRAVAQTAVVVAAYDSDLELQLPDGNKRVISVLDEYAPGTQIPVLVDPADDEWLRLRDEPADYTYWYAVAGGVWLLAILLLLRDIRRRRARPRTSWTGTGLPVRIDPDVSGTFAVRSADGAVLFGFVSVDPDDDEAADRLSTAFDLLDEEGAVGAPVSLRREWAQTLRRYQNEALLVGNVTEGSWPTVLVGDVPLRPVAPLRAPRRTPWSVESVESLRIDLDPDDDDHSGTESPVEAAKEVPALPWEVPIEPMSWWCRPALVAVVLAAPIAAGAFASWGEWGGAIAAVGAGGGLIHYLQQRVFYRVVAAAPEVRIRTGWFERVVDWRSVASVEIEEDRVSFEADDDWHVVGGIRTGQTAQVAAVFEALRLRARTGLPAHAGRRRIAPGLLIEGGYLAVCVLLLALMRWSPF